MESDLRGKLLVALLWAAVFLLLAAALPGCAQAPPPAGASLTLVQPDGMRFELRGSVCGIVPTPLGGMPRCQERPAPPAAREKSPPARKGTEL